MLSPSDSLPPTD